MPSNPESLLAILLAFPLLSHANSCIWLDTANNNATVPATGYSPCPGTSSSAASTCCADTDACLSNGYCSGQFGLYRGACTDWGAGVCPETCIDLSFTSNSQTFYLANLYRCNGLGLGETWWCGNQEDTTVQPCQSGVPTTFSMTSLGSFVTPVPIAAAAAVSGGGSSTGSTTQETGTMTSTSSGSGDTASAAVASTSTPYPAGRIAVSSRSNALGIGLSIGLGVPLILAIIALLYLFARRSRTEAGMIAREKVVEKDTQNLKQLSGTHQEIHGTHFQEIGDGNRRVVELPVGTGTGVVKYT